jgi:hypothetical protein
MADEKFSISKSVLPLDDHFLFVGKPGSGMINGLLTLAQELLANWVDVPKSTFGMTITDSFDSIFTQNCLLEPPGFSHGEV